MKNIGLFFGSFNPIHFGHLAVAQYFTENTDLEQVWLVISPQSPFKKKKRTDRKPPPIGYGRMCHQGTIQAQSL